VQYKGNSMVGETIKAGKVEVAVDAAVEEDTDGIEVVEVVEI
jgi:hypothetical protein